jgi:hypothetical protein
VKQASIGAPANHFPTPSVGDGVFLAAAAKDVVAFHAATNGAPEATATSSVRATSTTISAASSKSPSAAGGTPAGVIVAIVLVAPAVVGGAVWLWRRARRRGIAP